MPERIISVGVQIPGGKIEYARLSERISLLDWDIAILTTDMSNSFYYGSETYNGKVCLSDDASFKYSEAQIYWKKEISEAVNNGKSVVVFLEDFDEIYIATGQRTYSGTGRNQKTTRHVANANNYNLLPLTLDIRASIGTQICINSKYQYLKEYWSQFSEQSTFKVTFETKSIIPLLTTKTGSKPVGGLIINKESGGYLLLLPSIDFEEDDFTEVRGQKTYWSKKGIAFGGSLISSLISINKSIKSLSDKTPQPDWVAAEKYMLKKEIEIIANMVNKENKLSKIQAEIQKLKEDLLQEVSIKDLLYEQGKPLEYAILKALKLFGFSVSQYKENDSEFDVVFECPEGRLLGEAEGKDNKPINIDKLRQLEMNINEDFSRDEVDEIAKGVLFGNSCRLLALEERKEYFTEKCLIASARSNVALVKTQDLYFICQNIANFSDDDKKNIRKIILESNGIVDFSEYLTQGSTETSDEEK